MTQYRLLARAELDGAIREPGYLFELADGEIGPHRTVVASNHGAQITDHMNATQEMADVPLYEEVTEPTIPVVDDADAKTISEAHAKDKARIVDLEAQLVDKDKQLGEAHTRLAAIETALKAQIDSGAPLLFEAPVALPMAKA